MDPVHFSGREILEMALRIEENGERFYADAARASRSDRLRITSNLWSTNTT